MKPCISEKQTQLQGLAVGHAKGRKEETAQVGLDTQVDRSQPVSLSSHQRPQRRDSALTQIMFSQVLLDTFEKKNFFF